VGTAATTSTGECHPIATATARTPQHEAFGRDRSMRHDGAVKHVR
jgi:hypothetical protein